MIIPGFSEYDITTDGVVTMTRTGRVIRPYVAKVKNSEYLQVSIMDDHGKQRPYNVMALLALTYLDKPLHLGIVRAKDGNNLNATLDNVVCTTQADVIRHTWQYGGLKDRRRRERCYSDESVALVYDVMQVYDRPVSMAELSSDLQVPYSTVRYSMTALRAAGKVRKIKEGFEVVK